MSDRGASGVTDTSNVMRVEVIDLRPGGEGRCFVRRFQNAELELSLQDDGRTLKIFLQRKSTATTRGLEGEK